MTLPSPAWRLLALVPSLLLAGSAFAIALPKGVVQGPAVEGITEYRLPNGLKVLLFPDASKPTVTVNVTYLVGSRHENYGETGMAHLLEHLMFKGTPTYPRITEQFAERGMQYNGSTTFDRTNYYEVFPSSEDNLQWALRMEAARMVHSNIAQRDLDSEMTVVRNEFESGENSPTAVMIKRLQSVAYDWHAYGRATIGNRSDIEHVGIANLRAFYRTYYQPDNAVLLVAGKFEPGATLGAIARNFGAIPRPKRALPQFWTVEPVQDGERSVMVRRQGDVQFVALAYKMPSELHPDSDALAFVSDILGNTPNGRLHKLLVDSGRAIEVISYGMGGVAPGLQIIGAAVKKGEPIEPVRDALIEAAEGFAKIVPTPEEMERVRRNIANDIEKSLNDPQQVGLALSDDIALGDWRLFFVGRDRATQVTAAQVAAAAGRYLRRDNRVVGVFVPETAPQRAEIPPTPTVQEAMKDFKAQASTLVSENFDPSQANILARTKLSHVGGLKLALLPKKNRGETVAVNLRLHWGDVDSLFGKDSLPDLTEAMLTRGTSKYTREQLADAFEKLKISGSLYGFETTREHLADALRLVAHVLKEPSFAPAQFEQLREQSLVGTEATRSDPQALAARAMNEYYDHYPKGDVRAVKTIDEEMADLKAARREDAIAFHRDFYGASHGELAIVGDFDAAAIAPLVEELFGHWPSAAHYAPILESNAERAALRKTIDTPDKENGNYLARLNLDLNIDDAAYPALMLANHIFGGGGLKSRLLERIRQKEGLSYSASSELGAGDLDRAGAFEISAIAAPQNLGRVDAAVREELQRALKDGFTEHELAGAKSGILQAQIQNRSQDSALASGWTRFLFLGKTFAWSGQFEQKLAKVTLAEMNAAFRRAIDPEKLSVVMAGDQAKAKLKADGVLQARRLP
jgi:zinc protease